MWFKMHRMKIYLDDQPASFSGDDLKTILAQAQQQLAPSGRSIVEVHLDGQPLMGDELNRCMDQAPSLVGRTLHLVSADPRQLATEVLQQVQQQLDIARDELALAAEAFQQDQSADGIARVGSVIQIWLQVQQAIGYGSAMANLNLDDKTFEDQPVPQHIQQLLEQIRQLRDQLAQRDTLGLADSLAYEWPATLDRWQRLVGQVILWIQS